MPGKLHLNSRSLVFEPENMAFPLLRLKFCDNLRLSFTPDITIKNILGQLLNMESKDTNVIFGLIKIEYEK